MIHYSQCWISCRLFQMVYNIRGKYCTESLSKTLKTTWNSQWKRGFVAGAKRTSPQDSNHKIVTLKLDIPQRCRDEVLDSFPQLYSLFLKKILFINFFLERSEGKEKEREGNISVWLPLACPLLQTRPATQACALIGNRTGDPLLCRPELNPLSHISQGSTVIFSKSSLIEKSWLC